MIASLAVFGACADDEASTSDPISSSANMLDAAANTTAGKMMDSLNDEDKLYVKVPVLYIRSGPGMKYKTIGTVKFNEAIIVKEKLHKGAWIKLDEGQYVGGRYLSETKNDKAWIPAKYAH